MPFEQLQPQNNPNPNLNKEKFKIAFVDTSHNLESEAMDTADAKMTASKEDLKGLKGVWKRIWHHNLAHPYYRRKEYELAKNKILDEKNLYANEGANSKEDYEKYEKTLFDQFTNESESVIHRKAGEERKTLEGEASGEVKSKIKDLLFDYVKGSIDEANFKEEESRIFNELKGVSKDVIDKGVFYSSNMLETAKQLKQSFEHNEGLERLDLDFDVIVGRAKSDVRTEAKFNSLDRIIDKVQQSKIGCFVNETTVSSALSIAYCLGAGLARKTATSKFAAWGSFGATAVLGSGIAAAREKKRLEEERRQHFREMAQGKKFEAGSKRREDMERFRYETEEANTLYKNLIESLYQENGEGKRETKQLDEAGFREAVNKLIEIEARLNISDEQKIDLISFSDKTKVVVERYNLDSLRGKAKMDLEKMVAEGKIKIGEKTSFAEFLELATDTRVRNLIGGDNGIEKKNELFKKERNKKVWQAGVRGFVIGVSAGAIGQEIGAFFRPGQEGYIEGIFNKNPKIGNLTVLEYTRRFFSGDFPKIDASKVHSILIGNNTVNLPEGANLIKNPDGTYNLLRGSEVVGDHLKFDANGSLSQESQKALAENGVMSNSRTIPGEQPANPKETVHANENLTKRIKRLLWYDNDTPKPVFDKNELKLHWGGVRGTGIDVNGNYVFNIKQMAADGSYHGKFSVNAQEAMKAGNKLKILLSLSRDTQNQPFEVDIDTNGNAIIDPKSEIGKLFFAEQGGKAKFLGKFAEVGEAMGKTKDGTEGFRILSTVVGPGAKAPDAILPPIAPKIPDHVITDMLVPQKEFSVEPPPFIPILGRNPLEKLKDPNLIIPYYQQYNAPANEKLKKIFEQFKSKTLKENSKAKLDHYKETDSYLDKLDPEYKKQIEMLSDQFGEMSKENKLTVCIPVAGHQEEKNIYESLKSFTYQDIDLSKFEISLFVNHPEFDKGGNKILPDKTLKEIERFKKEFPNINVKMAYSALQQKQANIGTVRKLLTDTTLFRHHERGENVDDLIILSNDADNKGIAPQYIRSFIEKFKNNPKMDGLLGQLDWDPESYTKYPAIHFGTRLFQYLNIIGRRRSGGLSSSGANFAFKSSIYAAIGGYIDNIEGGEDIAIGQAIINARGDRKCLGFSGARTSRLYTSSRRAIDAWKSGIPPLQQWEKGFSPFDDEIRRLEIDKSIDIDYDKPEIVEKIKMQLEYVLNRTLDVYESGEKLGKNSPYYKKALGWLGIKYRLDEKGDIIITNISKVVDNLKNYKEDALLLKDMKTGKEEAAKKFKEKLEERKRAIVEKTNKINKKLDSLLKDFYSKDKLKLNYSGKIANTNIESESKDKERIGDYVIAKDLEVSKKENGNIALAYKVGSENEILVAKEMKLEDVENLTKMHGNASTRVETYLKEKGFTNDNFILPEGEAVDNDKLIRFYKAGDTDLEKYLDENNKIGEKESISILVRICDGLKELHKVGVVCTDIAPSNIVFSNDSVKIIDLDGASIDRGNGIFRREFMGGNRFILAPEFFNDRPKFGKTVDIYAASAMLFRMIAGKWPYDIRKKVRGLSHEEIMKEYGKLHRAGNIKFPASMPAELQRIIKKGMNPDPGSRYQSMEEFLVDLAGYYKKTIV